MRRKMVNGKIVPMTAAEEAGRDADEARVAAEKITPKASQRTRNVQADLDAALARIAALEKK